MNNNYELYSGRILKKLRLASMTWCVLRYRRPVEAGGVAPPEVLHKDYYNCARNDCNFQKIPH
eukprot:571661-Amphidinium_carterae.1